MLVQININGTIFNVKQNISVLQACESVNIFLPRFCYHERLSVAGNCRMCLIEVDKLPKLQVSCSILVSQNMHIKTDSFSVKKAREGVLEFLLLNHPLDCPICDQGGECDLQDQALIYGGDKNRFKEFRRATKDKNCSPLIKTIMTRCIHCTRCVRFASEVVGITDFGTSGRGNSLEIGMYINKLFSSELSGNVIDLCPVGALTSKPYSFLTRPWELKSVESIDVFDSIHSNIRVDVKGYDIMRVIPRLNESINEEWISDKARFAFDGIYNQRVTKPLIRNSKGKFVSSSWVKAIDIILSMFSKISGSNKVCFSVGSSCDLETLFFVKNFSNLLNAHVLTYGFENSFNVDYQFSYKFNTLLKNIFKSDCCLLIGLNPKVEGALLNYHLRKRFLFGNFSVGFIGSALKMSFPCLQLGSSTKTLMNLIEGKNFFCKFLRKSKKPLVIVGKSFIDIVKSPIPNQFFEIFSKNLNLITDNWNGFNFFSYGSNDFSIFDLDLKRNRSFIKSTFGISYVIENLNFSKHNILSSFFIYQGHFFCKAAQVADIILPSCSFFEKTSLFGNCEGRYQFSQSVIASLDKSKKSSYILSKILKKVSPSIIASKTFNKNFTFDRYIKYFIPSYFFCLNSTFNCDLYCFLPYTSNFFLDFLYIPSGIYSNFYQTDAISEFSLIMSKCSQTLLDKTPFLL